MTEALVEKEKELTAEEQVAKDNADELAKQSEELEAARKKVEARDKDPLPAPFLSTKYHVGVGPLAYETRRGLVKAHSGDVILQYEYKDLGPDGEPVLDKDGNPVMLRDTIIIPADAAIALFPDKVVREPAEMIAARAGEKRRLAKWEKDHPKTEPKKLEPPKAQATTRPTNPAPEPALKADTKSAR